MQQIDHIKVSLYTKILMPLLAGNGVLEYLKRMNPNLEQWQKAVVVLTAVYICLGIMARAGSLLLKLIKLINDIRNRNKTI